MGWRSRRRMLLGSGSSLTPPELYFRAAGITNTTEQDAVKTLYSGLKDNNLYNRLDRLYLCSPTGKTAMQTDFITLELLQELGGSLDYTSVGIGVDGIATAINSNWKPATSTKVSLANNLAQLGFYITSGDLLDFGAGCLAGAYENALTQMLKIDVGGDLGSYQYIGYNKDFLVSSAATTFTTTLQLGPGINSRTSNIYNFTQAYWFGGIETGVKTTATSGAYPNVAVYFGCVNANGTQSQFPDITSFIYFGSMWAGGALDESEANVMMNLINDYNTALGRGVY